MWIMVAGPYSSGNADPAQRAANLRALNEAPVAILKAGHVPVVGVNMALPMIDAAGGSESAYHSIMMPISLALAERCDACVRIAGASKGANDEVQRFQAAGRPVFRSIAEIPGMAVAAPLASATTIATPGT